MIVATGTLPTTNVNGIWTARPPHTPDWTTVRGIVVDSGFVARDRVTRSTWALRALLSTAPSSARRRSRGANNVVILDAADLDLLTGSGERLRRQAQTPVNRPRAGARRRC